MKIVLTLLCILAFSFLPAQENIKVYHEKIGDRIVILVDNAEYCPVSVAMRLELDNMIVTRKTEDLQLIPARSTRYEWTALRTKTPNRASKFNYKSRHWLGDVTQESYDTDYAYRLPYAPGQSFEVWQGYNGSFSHRNENALDFSLSEGTEVHAARGGIVIKVIEKFSRHCPTKDCAPYNNLILIYHSDGTMAEYSHLRKEGAVVDLGEEVEAGQLIGYSGNTGWSTGPHLHFDVHLPGRGDKRTVPTQFQVAADGAAILLEERGRYLRGY